MKRPTLTPPTPDEIEIVSRYEARFGMLSPPLDYGQGGRLSYRDQIALAQAALLADKPISWSSILKPIPDGAVS